jgi:Phosphotransferase enzyme family
LPGVRIEPVETLRRTERSEVLRVRAVRPGRPEPQMLIVKVFRDAGEGWVRESAALAAAPAGAPMPRLVAASAGPPVVVMTDAGTGPSVADVLLGDDAAEARTAVERLAAALGTLHLSTRGVRDAFGAELAARSGGTVPESAMPGFVTGAASALAGFCDQLGVRVPDGALSALADLPDRLGAAGPAALTLADACPDNNVRAGDGYVLIDFEEAEWRHIAWDVAYLTVPWPSCWCSFRLPAEVTQQALARYRTTIGGRLPRVDTPAFDHDVALATTGWAFVSVSWFLRAALRDDRPLDDTVAGLPTRRAVILHRLGDARNATALPALAEFAARLRTELVRRWGEVPLEPAPAFRPPAGAQRPADSAQRPADSAQRPGDSAQRP